MTAPYKIKVVIMQSNQALDTIIRPVLSEMNEYGKYNTHSNRMLLLVTYAVNQFNLDSESVFNTARGWSDWPNMTSVARKLSNIYDYGHSTLSTECEINKRIACLVMMGKYSMQTKRLPSFDDKRGLYDCYRTTNNDDINYGKWCEIWTKYKLDEVEL